MKRVCIILIILFGLTNSTQAKRVVQRDSITIHGRVLCDGKGVAGVSVSDGVHIVQTDSLGYYGIASNKFQSVVFITTPSGYEPLCRKRVLPNFWAPLKKPREEAEQHDFHLRKRNNDNHRIIFISNLALQNSNDDILQFKRVVVPAAKRVMQEVGDSVAVYTIALGDTSVCRAWYSREFDIEDALSTMAQMRYPSMLYSVMGDQDHNGAIPGTGLTDYNSERHYVYTCGPKYFSMDIGEAHYIFLDNTVFRNSPGKGRYPTEIVGKCDYDRFVTSEQLEWLRKDLALVKDKSRPIVVCMHNMAFTTGSKGRMAKKFSKPEQVDSLLNNFKEFKNVHLFTGSNTTRRISKTKEAPHIIEHSVGSTSGNRWSTGYERQQLIHSNGADAQFEVLDIKGRSLSWHPYSLVDGRKPLRLYDMSSVGAYFRDNLDIQNLVREHSKVVPNYGLKDFERYIYINYWGYEPGTKIEIFENGKRLRVRKVMQADPLYLTAWTAPWVARSVKKPRVLRNSCHHLFRAQRNDLKSTIRVKVTSPFGQCYEEVFEGSKRFTLEMR